MTDGARHRGDESWPERRVSARDEQAHRRPVSPPPALRRLATELVPGYDLTSVWAWPDVLARYNVAGATPTTPRTGRLLRDLHDVVGTHGAVSFARGAGRPSSRTVRLVEVLAVHTDDGDVAQRAFEHLLDQRIERIVIVDEHGVLVPVPPEDEGAGVP